LATYLPALVAASLFNDQPAYIDRSTLFKQIADDKRHSTTCM